MRIVMANKYWYLKGGAERYVFDLTAMLEARGHQVVPFAMQGSKSLPTPFMKHFVSEVTTDKVSFGWQGIRTAARMLYSFEARRKFAALAEEVHPDILHVHNIYHQIGPSFLSVARAKGIPVVLTAHDYALVSPNYSLFHHGRIDEPKVPGDFSGMIGRRAVKDSVAATALAVFEAQLHEALGLYAKNVDRIIAPSRFMQSTLVRHGIPEERVVHVPHPIDARAWTPSDAAAGTYALYVGRLVEEKGVETLIRAAAKLPGVPVRIVGTGPDEAKLKALAKDLGATNVRFDGFQEGAALKALYAGARYLVVPSLWYEVFGLIVLEAYAAGKPVIASQIGGLGELVQDGDTGVLVSAGDVEDLAEQMSDLWAHPDTCGAMGRAGRAWVEKDFAPGTHYDRIIEVYNDAARHRAEESRAHVSDDTNTLTE